MAREDLGAPRGIAGGPTGFNGHTLTTGHFEAARGQVPVVLRNRLCPSSLPEPHGVGIYLPLAKVSILW